MWLINNNKSRHVFIIFMVKYYINLILRRLSKRYTNKNNCKKTNFQPNPLNILA